MGINATVKEQVFEICNGRCWYCGIELIRPRFSDAGKSIGMERWFVPDHVVAIARGGTDELDNLLPACWTCNSSKGAKTIEEYRLHIAMKTIGIKPFTQDQLDYLSSYDITVPLPTDDCIFWGETS